MADFLEESLHPPLLGENGLFLTRLCWFHSVRLYLQEGTKKNAFVHLIRNVYVYCKKKIRKVLLLNVAHDFS